MPVVASHKDSFLYFPPSFRIILSPQHASNEIFKKHAMLIVKDFSGLTAVRDDTRGENENKSS